MHSPLVDYLGVGCALTELAERHNDKDEYGKAAILFALAKQLETYNSALEYVEDLVAADNDERKDRAIARLKEWAKPWRRGAQVDA